MKECDHAVAYHADDSVLQSEIVPLVRNLSVEWNSHNEIMRSIGCKDKQYKTVHDPSYFLDRRRTPLNMFNYCPDCGDKINWKTIKGRLK